MVEIGTCDECRDPAAKVRGVTRHLHKDQNGLQFYTNNCMEEGCGCTFAKMAEAKLALTQEKEKWSRAAQRAFG